MKVHPFLREEWLSITASMINVGGLVAFLVGTERAMVIGGLLVLIGGTLFFKGVKLPV